jgi:hypothetical protein
MSRSHSAGLPPPVAPSEIATGSTRQGTRVWPTVLVWILLGAAIAAPWALLLLGDSLRPTG